MPNGKKGNFTAELSWEAGFKVKVEKLSFSVNGSVKVSGQQMRLLLETRRLDRL